MIKKNRRKLVSIMFFSALTAVFYVINAQCNTDAQIKINLIDTQINEKLEYYKLLYPEISFLLLKGDSQVLADMMLLGKTLGRQPKSMDYEHPPELREDLITVSLKRIQLMLQYKMPSASLFMTEDEDNKRKPVCVLTIHPEEVALDSILATQSLLDLPQKIIKKVPKKFRLKSDDYLEFVIDHEVYHCLQAKFIGPQKMSYKEYAGKYYNFHNEQGADAYAIAMHINTRLEVTAFARNILRVRGMSLYSADPDHLTCKALQQVFKISVEDIAEMNAKEIFEMANKIRERLTISYDEYIRYMASSIQAMKELGVGELVTDELRNIVSQVQSDPVQVNELVTNTHRYLSNLSCSELE